MQSERWGSFTREVITVYDGRKKGSKRINYLSDGKEGPFRWADCSYVDVGFSY